jgi:hypothetical protein
MQSNKNADLDLDIRNYSKEDLFAFFKISDNFSEAELNEREKEISMAIMKAEGPKYTTEYKFNVLNFVKTVKDILKSNIMGDSLQEKFGHPVIEKTLHDPPNIKIPSLQPNNVGRLMNPHSNHPTFQYMSIPFQSPNGYNTSTTITNYVFNTKFRDEYFKSISTNSTYSFPTVKNVISVSLAALQFPNVIYTFTDVRNTTKIYIKDDNTGNEAVVVIPEGNYTKIEFPIVLEKAINEQVLGVYVPGGPNIFTVVIEPNTTHTVISNSSGTFTIRTITSPPNILVSECDEKFDSKFKYDDNYKKLGLSPSYVNNTLGYQIGYRLLKYSGSNIYISEGCYDEFALDYIYFSMNEFTNVNYVKNTVGVLPSSIINNNILTVVPVFAEKFAFTYDNESDYIFKRRNYLAPVDISRINIKLLDPTGNILDLQYSDFSFVLQFTCIFDNTIPYVSNAVSVI